jgi:uncharacterized NAD(P)/FAD-binding protein YdhS
MDDAVVIVGAGASGTLSGLALASGGSGPDVTLVDGAGAFARGVAYSTSEAVHLLNVPATRMGALPDAPLHFLDWLRRREPSSGEYTFARRSLYGAYLSELLDSAPRPPRRLTAEVRDLEAHGSGLRLALGDGSSLHARAGVLAMGNFPPALPPDWEALPERLRWRSPWGGKGRWPEPDEDVLILGSSLTAVDVVLSLDARGHRGQIHLLSRRGLLPWTHAPTPLAPIDARPLPRTVRALVAHLRRLGERQDLRAVVDALRAHTEDLWVGLSPADQARFLRHLRTWFDTLRHRLAPEVGARVARLELEGRLVRHAGRIQSLVPEGERLRVTFRPRGERALRTISVGLAVPSTGPALQLAEASDPLLRRLLGCELIQPGPHGLGIATARDGAVLGPLADRLWTLGSLRRGDLWETTALAEIRVQAQALARVIRDRLGG